MKRLVNFLRRLFPPIHRAPDKNVANIGDNVQIGQFAQGRNILQLHIGAFVFPVRTLLALVGIALLAAFAVWWIVTPSQMPQGGAAANAALVEFGARDAQGHVTSSAQGAALSEWLYNRLNLELADMPETARPNFWHLATHWDLAHLFQKRVTAPPQTDADIERIAQQVGASIVLYGNLAQGQSAEAFVPQLYMAQKKGEADELTGSQQLGQPIPLPASLNDEYLAAYLQPLGRALVWFSRGLQNDLNGRYDLAYQILKQGEQNLTDWDENQGKEVLYYFIGREALFLANCENDARIVFTPTPAASAVAQALTEAETYFARAQTVAERSGRTYARATFGLGQVALQRAQRELIPPDAPTVGQCRINVSPVGAPLACPPRRAPNMDAESLEKARAYVLQAVALFDRALTELPQPAPSRLESKLRGARASADVLRAQLELLAQNFSDAESFSQNAQTALTPLPSATARDDRRTLATLYLVLGAAHLANANARLAQQDTANARTQLQNALAAYDACIQLIPSDEPDAFLRTNLGPNCVCTRRDTQTILDGLR